MNNKIVFSIIFLLLSMVINLYAQNEGQYRVTGTSEIEHGSPSGTYYSQEVYNYHANSQTEIVSCYYSYSSTGYGDNPPSSGSGTYLCDYTDTTWADTTRYDYDFPTKYYKMTIIKDGQGRPTYKAQYYYYLSYDRPKYYKMYYSTLPQPDSVIFTDESWSNYNNNRKYNFIYDQIGRKQLLYTFSHSNHGWVDQGYYEYQYTSPNAYPHPLDIISRDPNIEMGYFITASSTFDNLLFDATWPTSDIIYHSPSGASYSTGWGCSLSGTPITFQNQAQHLSFSYNQNGLIASCTTDIGTPYSVTRNYAWENVPTSISDPLMPSQNLNIINYPNPFTAKINMNIKLVNSDHTKLCIYNVKGQKVKIIADGFLSKGEHTYQWDGKDDHGNSVANGVYIGKLASGGQIRTCKMVLLK